VTDKKKNQSMDLCDMLNFRRGCW